MKLHYNDKLIFLVLIMKTVIFDLDGTLVDTYMDLLDAGNLFYKSKNWNATLDPEINKKTVINGGKSMIEYGLKNQKISYNKFTLNSLYPSFLSCYDKTIFNSSYLYDGIEDLLIKLKSENWQIGLCTNKPEMQANMLLNKLKIRSYFNSFIGSDTLNIPKPNPEPLLKAIDILGGKVKNSVLVGDTITDRLTAKAAGTKSLLVNYGHGALIEDLSYLEADAMVNQPKEISSVIESLI